MGSSITDSGPNGYHGSLTGTINPTIVASPSGAAFNNAMTFDGVNRGDATMGWVMGGVPAVGSTHTLEYRVTPTVLPGAGLPWVIAGRFAATATENNAIVFLTENNNPSGASKFSYAITYSDQTNLQIFSTTTAVAGTTYAVAGTSDGTTARLFVNGVLEASAPITKALQVPAASSSFAIGRESAASSGAPYPYPGQGQVDEVRLSSVARYTANYTPATAPFTSDASTIGLWHLDSIATGRVPQARVFLTTKTAPNSGNLADLGGNGAGVVASTIARFATAGTTSTIIFVPGIAYGGPQTIPGVGAAPLNAGWRDAVAENANEQITYQAGTWGITLRLTKSGQGLTPVDVTVRVTVILYRSLPGGAASELARGTFADTPLSTGTLTLASGLTLPVTTFAPNERAQWEVYVQTITAGTPVAPTTAVDIALRTDSTATTDGSYMQTVPSYSVQYIRSGAETPAATGSAQRAVTATRAATDTAPTSTQTAVRAVTAARATSDANAVPTDAATKVIAFRRNGAETTAQADSTTRTTTTTRLPAEPTTQVDTAVRAYTTVRVGTDATSQADAAARAVAAMRATSDTLAATADSVRRVVTAARTGAEGTMATSDTATRTSTTTRVGGELTNQADLAARVASSSRLSTDATSVLDAAARIVSAARVGAETTTQLDAATRQSLDVRRATQSDAVQLDTAARALTFLRPASDALPQLVAVESHTITYGRTTREYTVPTDGPITLPTKFIQGTVYLRAGGSVYLGGAQVTLIRDSDGLEVATTTSSAVNGTYSFVRDQFDTNTYTTRIKRQLVGGNVEEAISANGLVPV